MFRALLVHYQGECNCIKLFLIQMRALSNCFIQLWVLPDDGPSTARNMHELVFYNIIVILIKLCAFIGVNCNNWIVMQGMENEIKRYKSGVASVGMIQTNRGGKKYAVRWRIKRS